MALHTVRKGVDLPIGGKPQQTIEAARAVTRVALCAADYRGLKPRMEVKVGDEVKRGQRLFEDRKTPGVFYTSPAAGQVAGINRGERRALLSVTIELSDSEREGKIKDDEREVFSSYTGKAPGALDSAHIRHLLLQSGLWTALRTRPFGKVPQADAEPGAIFITAADSYPLAPSVDVALNGQERDFVRGVRALARLTDGKTYVCQAPGLKASSELSADAKDGIRIAEFQGKHPSGTAGLHIHVLEPASRSRTVWSIGYQDVVSIGILFDTGRLEQRRVISLAGPGVARPRLLETRLGADISQLVNGELAPGDQRAVAGSILSGRKVTPDGDDPTAFLGRFENQVDALPEDREREFLGWLMPGAGVFSIIPAFLAKFLGDKVSFTTSTHGSPRAMVPIGMYEKVMPFDLMPTFLLRALAVSDLETSEALGALELDEEDLSLCTFVCPGKTDWGQKLRDALTQIEKEG